MSASGRSSAAWRRAPPCRGSGTGPRRCACSRRSLSCCGSCAESPRAARRGGRRRRCSSAAGTKTGGRACTPAGACTCGRPRPCSFGCRALETPEVSSGSTFPPPRLQSGTLATGLRGTRRGRGAE
eukprot:1196138-Prorocentrum_minimum.AAC.5